MSKRYSCHKISEGKAQAEAIKTHDRIMFYQVRPEDGVMEEKDHELLGRSISQKVLLFPAARAAPWCSRTACITWTASTTCPRP